MVGTGLDVSPDSLGDLFGCSGEHDFGDETVALPRDEAEHLTRVLRLKAGAAVRVFDGRGREFDASVEKASKSGVEVVQGEIEHIDPEKRETVVGGRLLGGDHLIIALGAELVPAKQARPVRIPVERTEKGDGGAAR